MRKYPCLFLLIWRGGGGGGVTQLIQNNHIDRHQNSQKKYPLL